MIVLCTREDKQNQVKFHFNERHVMEEIVHKQEA